MEPLVRFPDAELVMHSYQEDALDAMLFAKDLSALDRRVLNLFLPNKYITRLQEAASHGQCGDMKLMIDAGADVEMRECDYHWTALFFAVEAGKPGAVKVLLEHGANVYAVNRFGETVMDVAAGGDQDIMDMLIEHCFNKASFI